MKNFKTLIVLLLLTISSINEMFAQASAFGGKVDDFEILPQYLENGKLKVDPNSSTVTFQYKVKFVRTLLTGTEWKLTDIKIAIGTLNSSNQPVLFNPSYTITNADFSNNSAFLDKTYSITINKSELIIGKNIFLTYQLPGMPTYDIKSPQYQIAIATNNPGTPGTPNSLEGWLFDKTINGVYYVFSVMDGKARHIQDPGTLAAVYANRIIRGDTGSLAEMGLTEGAPIPPGTELLRDKNDGKIYFMEWVNGQQVLRHIVSIEAVDKYRFTLSRVRNIYGVSGYVIGPVIQ